MKCLVEDVWERICDDGGERWHGIVVGHVFIGSKLPRFLFNEQHDLCDVLWWDLASSWHNGSGRIRGWLVGRIGNAETGEGAEEGRFYRQERVPADAACQCLSQSCSTLFECSLPATHWGVCGMGVDGSEGGKFLVGESCTDVGNGSHSCGEAPCGSSKRRHRVLLSWGNHELG